MSIQCRDIIRVIEQWAKPSLAEEWDNVGLHVGDPEQPVERIMLALTPSEAAIAAAVEQQADMLVTHHPLLFKPIKAVTAQSAAGRSIYQLVRNGVALYCAHTSLDAADGGVNDILAKALGLEKSRALIPAEAQSPWYKLVVYVPQGYEEIVRQAICAAGAGRTEGYYDNCTFRGAGTGTFRPLEGAEPFLGEAGEVNQVPEFRLETVVHRAQLEAVLTAMLAAHPYEEVAYDLFKLAPDPQQAGMGRIGTLPQAVPLERFLAQTARALQIEDIAFCGDRSRLVQTVALCGGSGSSFLKEAKRAGADVYVTGDMKYHDGQLAQELDLPVIDAGHFATERLILPIMAQHLQQTLGLEPEQVWVWQDEEDFLQHYHHIIQEG